jgi:nitrogen fixation/metabolism regulation signal transduction histidine kinase
MCRGTSLKGTNSGRDGKVIVFDDVTALIQAQRDAAWGEVARRLAHEIKNPLTPIQLSAERLRRRFIERMDKEDVEVLDRATRTIVNQVEAMKKMVNAFSEYARIPQISLEAVDLNMLVQEVLELYRGVDSRVKLVTRLDAQQPCIEGDVGRLRQLLHNLLKNSLEAVAETAGACITVTTHTADESERAYVELVIDDNGPGFPERVLDNIFEPYVSTKPRGSGLGLAIVKKIVEEHGGVIAAESNPEGGARIRIRLQSAEVTDCHVETNSAGDNRIFSAHEGGI